MTKAELLLKELYLSREKTRGILENLTAELQKSISFEIFIEEQPSEGLLVMTDDSEITETVASGHRIEFVMALLKENEMVTPDVWGLSIY